MQDTVQDKKYAHRELRIIGNISTDFPSKFGIPRQSGLVPELRGTIRLTSEYRNPDALRGMEGFSHIWLLWLFSESLRSDWSPTVRPPRLGGNRRLGVFATRSPFRPNPIGMSVVRLESIDYHSENGPLIHVSGADLMDGTPILDIKPYLPHIDAIPNASGGFAEAAASHRLKVHFPSDLLHCIANEKQSALIQVLSQDPRPAYQDDPDRIYGMTFAGMEIRFSVQGEELFVISAEPVS